MSVNGAPKAMLLDAAGTLVRCEPSVGVIYARVAERFGAHVAPEAFVSAFADLWPRHTELARRRGPVTSEEVERGWWRAFTGEVASRVGLAIDVDAWFEALWEEFARADVWALYPDVVESLARLRSAGVRTGILTNWDARCLRVFDGLGLTRLVDFVLVSSLVGVRKPGRGIFEEALRRAGATASEAVHVGDSLPDDYEGALAAGLGAVLLVRGSKAPPEGVRWARDLAGTVSVR
ncbi:MAG: HAD-IA family hydrolase [Planctomycetota bacterium]